jgi:anaerobic ribonucleoside-triphosphate reductase activating protein
MRFRIQVNDNLYADLLKYTDILVAGRFDSSKLNNNQKIYLLNNNVDVWEFNNSDVEIEINDDIDIKITGYPTDELISEIKENIYERV